MPEKANETDVGGAMPGLPASLQALMTDSNEKALPPVETWQPDYCGDLDIRIARDGRWFYLGSPISRERLVRLFASVLRKDADGRTYLVTPVEKIGIEVEDAPFLASEMVVDGDTRRDGVFVFKTNVGDVVRLQSEQGLRFEIDKETDGFKAYLLVRGQLEALLSRALMYDLVALASEGEGDHRGQFGLYSAGHFYPICALEDISSSEASQ